jgi:hypothetical protein
MHGGMLRARVMRGKPATRAGLVLATLVLAGLALVAGQTRASAATTAWNPIGSYTIALVCTAGCSGTYPHTMNVTAYDSGTGNFSGTGHYNPEPSYTWNVNGNTTGSAITFHIVYTGSNPGYTIDATGTIAADGSLSGTATGPGQSFTWSSTSGHASAGPNYGSSQLDSSHCGLTKQSKNVVNVSFRMINDYDSGVQGNAWANDTMHRELRIWQVSPGIFCATVTDTSKFVTFAGPSPNGTGTVSAGIPGQIRGGEVTGPFAGSLNPTPAYPTRGNIGLNNTFDLHCTSASNCPGARPTISSYVNGYAGQLQWWGWQYVTDSHGIWVNSSDGNSGDITG